MDEQQAWEQFIHTGRVSDYLAYSARCARAQGAPDDKGAAPNANRNDGYCHPGAVGW